LFILAYLLLFGLQNKISLFTAFVGRRKSKIAVPPRVEYGGHDWQDEIHMPSVGENIFVILKKRKKCTVQEYFCCQFFHAEKKSDERKTVK
jgi:hypothetical protein